MSFLRPSRPRRETGAGFLEYTGIAIAAAVIFAGGGTVATMIGDGAQGAACTALDLEGCDTAEPMGGVAETLDLDSSPAAPEKALSCWPFIRPPWTIAIQAGTEPFSF